MERVIQVLNRMRDDGIVSDYAIGGGIAAVYYIEPYDTDDLDIFIPVPTVAVGEAGLLSLEPIYSYLANLGYKPVKEGVLIEDWLVQFIPVSESTQEDALVNARRAKYGNTDTKIFSPENLAAELLRSGRLKDHVRVVALLESGKLNMSVFREILERHDLEDKWRQFNERFELEK